MTTYSLVWAFRDPSPSFVHGVEAGILWQRMQAGDDVIECVTVHSDNLYELADMAEAAGYVSSFSSIWDAQKIPDRTWIVAEFRRVPIAPGFAHAEKGLYCWCSPTYATPCDECDALELVRDGAGDDVERVHATEADLGDDSTHVPGCWKCDGGLIRLTAEQARAIEDDDDDRRVIMVIHNDR